ncbi:MAG: hypothetical protein WAQ27_05335 [Candidatus Microsaccharimonas sp.]
MMVKKRGAKKLFVALAILVAVLLVVAVIVIIKLSAQSSETSTNKTPTKDTPAISDEAPSTDKATDETPAADTAPAAIDPASVLTVDIEPMSLAVSYMKGIGGFEYGVLRTPSGTKYVQFSSTKLIGTKCTNDEGIFASIIDSPTADETSTLAKTTVVDGKTYGLSLADPTCTSDAGLLKQYQDAFSEPFSLLKKNVVLTNP